MIFFLYRHPNSDILYYVMVFTEYVAIISAGLAVFNIIPISPLDGSKGLFAFLPQSSYYKLMHYERYGMILLMVVLLLGWLDVPLVYLRSGLLNGLQAITMWPWDLLQHFLG